MLLKAIIFFYEFNEVTENSAPGFSYEELLENVNSTIEQLPQENDEQDIGLMMSDYVAQELDYNENYTMKQLSRIADYYEISKRKLKKTELIEAIVIFENNPENCEIVKQKSNIMGLYGRN